MKHHIPVHLKSSVKLVQSVFPDGIPNSDLWYVMRILGEQLSFRNIANTISYATDDFETPYYNDVLGAVNIDINHDRIAEIINTFNDEEYNDWLMEHDIPEA